MNPSTRFRPARQTGAATLFMALVLLIGITLVTLVSSKTVITETQIANDNYRAAQAVGAANYAMDFGVNHYNMGGFWQLEQKDAGGNKVLDYVDAVLPVLQSNDKSQTTTARLTYDNTDDDGSDALPDDNPCVKVGDTPTMGKGMIVATGFSDDGLARRTISQCVGPMALLNDDGPEMPLVARGSVGLTGNAKIINRYHNTTTWSGERVAIGSSASMETWLKDPAAGTLTEAQKVSVPTNGGDPSDAVLVSNRNLGNGLDIIDRDPSLGNLVGLAFFKNFFNAESRDQVRQLANSVGHVYTDIAQAIGQDGLIWIEGDQKWSGGVIGSFKKPAIVIINGDLETAGGSSTLYGLLYVAGKWKVAGTPQIIGSVIVEGTATPIDDGPGSAATPPTVFGSGSATVVYWPGFGGDADHPIAGLTTSISGSWRDW